MRSAPIKKKKPKSPSGIRYARKIKYIYTIDDLITECHTLLSMKMTKAQKKTYVMLYLQYMMLHILKGGKWDIGTDVTSVILRDSFQYSKGQKPVIDSRGNYYSVFMDWNTLDITGYEFVAGKKVVTTLQKIIQHCPEVQFRSQILVS